MTSPENKKLIKENIEELIEQGKIEAASIILDEYKKLYTDDSDVYSLRASIFFFENRIEEAINLLEAGVRKYPHDFDLLYNLGVIKERLGEYDQAYQCYLKANKGSQSEKEYLVKEALNRLGKEELTFKVRPKLAVFVKPGMDSFINEIIEELKSDYEVNKIITNTTKQIDEGMVWADICWFEWCDELIAHGSKQSLAQHKKIICRLHSYEAFTENPQNVNWGVVNVVIFVAEHIRTIVLANVKSLKEQKTVVIPNGISLDKYVFRTRAPGFNIAYVGYLNYKKGPMLLLHTFKAIYDLDQRYKLYIAGVFQDTRDVLYFRQMIQEMGLSNNIFFEGWQNNLDQWLEDKNYILCTSLLESQNMSVMQAMCKGIKPLIHNFVGAKNIYPEKYVWTTIGDCINAINQQDYNSTEYRDYIAEKYSLELHIRKIIGALTPLSIEYEKNNMNEQPVVTVGILNYNYVHYLNDSIGSVLEQSYHPIEIIIVDDCSSDGSIKKLEEYEKKYENIRVIYHKTNSGSAVLGFQEIIKEARGKYLAILSADDYYSDKSSIEEMVRFISLHKDCDYVYSNLQVVGENKDFKTCWSYQQYESCEMVREVFNRYGSGVIPFTTGLHNVNFFKRNNFNWFNDPDNRVAGDTLNTLICIKLGWRAKYLNKNLYCYRKHENNMTYDLRSRVKSLISVIEYLVNNFEPRDYLPEIEWDKYSETDKELLRLFLIGKYYYYMLNKYIKMKYNPFGEKIPPVTLKNRKDMLMPIRTKISYYFNKCRLSSENYQKEIAQYEKELKDIGY